MGISRSFVPYMRVDNFLGVNAKDTDENMHPGEWNKDSINIVSNPKGSVGSRNGFSAITTASIGTAVAWCGFYQFTLASGVDKFLGGASDGKLYSYASNTYTVIDTGLGDTDDDDRFTFHQLDDICVITDGENKPVKWTGTGSAVSLGGTTITADFGLEAWRYSWLHSTADPRLLFYCTTLGSVESGYTSFLNFDEDAFGVVGACRQGDDMIVGKRFSLFRVRSTGTAEKFEKYRIPSKVGPVNHQVMKETPDGRVIFLSADFNVYMLAGESIIPVGDNIKPVIKAGKNTRINNAVAGMLYDRNWYWLSFTNTSNGTTNDRSVIMDYSTPYQDKFGKLQYPWFIFSIGMNAFAEIYESGKTYLWSGDYTGQMHKQDLSTNDNGSAFDSIYKSPRYSMGDPTLNKKYNKLKMSYDNKGSHELDITALINDNASTQKNISQSMTGGAGGNVLWDVAQWGVDSWSSESDIDVGRDIDRIGRYIEITFVTAGLNEAWNIRDYTILAKPLKRS